jgi:hypothetical protein
MTNYSKYRALRSGPFLWTIFCPVIQFNECVTEKCPFRRIYGRDIASDTVSECHIDLQFR